MAEKFCIHNYNDQTINMFPHCLLLLNQDDDGILDESKCAECPKFLTEHPKCPICQSPLYLGNKPKSWHCSKCNVFVEITKTCWNKTEQFPY